MKTRKKKRIGILGYGNLGKYLYLHLRPDLDISFVWNRDEEKLDRDRIPSKYRLPPGSNLRDRLFSFFTSRKQNPDLVVEVSHPEVAGMAAPIVLPHCDFMVGSPTAFSFPDQARALVHASQKNDHRVLIPTGAAWGIHDIQRLARIGRLKKLEVEMAFHHHALKLESPLAEKRDRYALNDEQTDACLLYEGPIAELARLAPNNTNTMVCIALSGGDWKLGKTTGRLFAKKSDHMHEIRILVTAGGGFSVRTIRLNPAGKGNVTGKMTYDSYLSSILRYAGGEDKIGFC